MLRQPELREPRQLGNDMTTSVCKGITVEEMQRGIGIARKGLFLLYCFGGSK